ncbi:MAG TPA: FAD-dependent oxidoreductase [Acidimicrobiales bacterium]|nr:FAD-dependent oxidoreductase [Acidimicrobiales bacterium]
MTERLDADVCVLGARDTGLTVALRLHQHATSVVVLEARDRIGGRIWNEPLAHGTPIDRAGPWLGPRHDAIFGLAPEVAVPT